MSVRSDLPTQGVATVVGLQEGAARRRDFCWIVPGGVPDADEPGEPVSSRDERAEAG